MINKIFKKIKNIIYEYRYILCMIIVLLFIFGINFPYYIKSGGGIININERIKTNFNYKTSGSFNMAYVSELKATIPSLLLAYFNKWDIIPYDEQLNKNTTIKEDEYRSKLALNEANDIALLVAYNKLNKPIKITKTKLYITYIDESSDTDLKIGDEIITINNQSVSSFEEIKNIINTYNVSDNVNFEVYRNSKKYIKKAKVIELNNRKIVGISITADYEIETNDNIKFNFKNSESGPSGGLMMALAIYDNLSKEDITKGRKIVGTGTIDINGNVGKIDGIKYKLKGAVKSKADLFLVASENYEEAIKEKNKNNYNIKIIEIKNFNEAIDYLKK